FNTSFATVNTINGVNFVTVNTMALGGDKCALCVRAKLEIEIAMAQLRRETKEDNRPILLHHMPLYRESDEACNELDSQPAKLKGRRHTPNLWCLSQEETDYLLQTIQPRLSFCGHIHYGCVQNFTIAKDLVNREQT